MKRKKQLDMIASIVAGNGLIAFSVAAFFSPHGVIMGGVTGMALAVSHYLSIGLPVVVFGFNVCLFLLGAVAMGKKFAISTIASTFIYPIWLSIIMGIPGINTLTGDAMLASVLGGLVLGTGIGLVVRVGASTGGTDIIALLLHRWVPMISVAVGLYIIDFIILGIQVPFSNAEQILFGILVLLIETLTMNQILLLGKAQIQIVIISDKFEEIRENLLEEQDAGVTMIYMEKGYTHDSLQGVMCVIPGRKLYPVKEMIHEVDPGAFLTITQVKEVRGKGFSLARK
ncbi:hypothetical protein BHF69_00665 [Anaerostipes sp. 992a]|uniref:YitT family protein n=1 Tax=Anaerostipes sp. 992a TaxID=1261637 RepID=UPI000952C661|nr:YitT family protein [Anaerostipes sp. 992a]OLR65951.1 hypothetical protein BHF69_00665 [Anaerostipes sp. 992a]